LGIGGQTALKLIRQHGSIESILENINRERYQIPEDWPYQEARRLFKEPLVCDDDEQLQIKWTAPDEEGLINFLVTENGFNSDRVTKAVEKIKASKNKSTQNRLESFFKPVASSSAPIKRKETKCVLGSPKPVFKNKNLTQASCQNISSFSPPVLGVHFRHSLMLSKGVCFGI
ncbi:flap endonuclease 1-like, partial [Bidens hawaiensis]|uniref:flap endonuclease 1-like n=1 Tax=Bidens hawaiensis TaxID=980011 RepID=UPI00404AAD35